MSVFVLYEKHGVRTIIVDDIEQGALDIVESRFNEGYWYDNWDDGYSENQWEDRASEIVATSNGKAALAFLDERSEFEYEDFEIQ